MKLGKNVRVDTRSKIFQPIYESIIETVNDSVYDFDKDYSVWRLIVYTISNAIEIATI